MRFYGGKAGESQQTDGQGQEGGQSFDNSPHGLDTNLQFAGAETGKAEELISDEGKAEEGGAAVVAAGGIRPSERVVDGENYEQGDGTETDEPVAALGWVQIAGAGAEQPQDRHAVSAGPDDAEETGGEEDDDRTTEGEEEK